jgi:hypothetical protein
MLICADCGSSVSEVGMDIYVNNQGKVCEEYQYLCDKNCSYHIRAVIYNVVGDDVVYSGLEEVINLVEVVE